MIINILMFIIGFVLGFFFLIILSEIEDYRKKHSLNLKHKKHSEMRKKLEE